ncbi:acetoin utilization AcuC family protein [Tengunoibacter tsumagoiensis]|uniref:Acetoin utilization protein AcuC n=1 Tax=Tengunoibacter tsumagoiensis TaxID=2014871 RepID=A0A402A1F0_9CHLR|nr:acetoin utilization AcuC family protein [Tengunoibacter tsumagoiensis]GCE12977.1 hypothetical protein KTT_28360 [Tengunoibacter tsumagoiensis]
MSSPVPAHPQQRVGLIFDNASLNYHFGPTHPMQPARLQALRDLLIAANLWQPDNDATHLPTRSATLAELGLIHTADYLAAVQRLSHDEDGSGEKDAGIARKQLAMQYGFETGDTPAVPGMHEAAARIAGGTLVALSAVMGLPTGIAEIDGQEKPVHVFHPAGGLHHAWAERCSGFCIYNDAAVAIAHVLQASEAKILYLDFDAHHGDGVQRAFYDDPRVLTISFHETGRYLYPGTGDVLELGNGSGRGYTVNMPLEPFTEDDSYLAVMDELLSPLVTAFAPAVIISQHGCDTHAWDPLSHLSLTMRGIMAQMRAAHELAHTYCGGKWVALGGGGYDLYRVVPRAWSAVWAEMSGQPLPDRLPQGWIEQWRHIWEEQREEGQAAQEAMGKYSGRAVFPTTFVDQPEHFLPQPRREIISRTNQHTAGLLSHLVVPTSVRQAFPRHRPRSPLSGLYDLLHMNRTESPSRSRVIQTPHGAVLLRDFCPPSLVERLQADAGLSSFARVPEREHQLLLEIARSPDCALTLAHTPTGKIVGEVTIAPADEWWGGIENVYEVAIEVSSDWRGLGIAREILEFALELDAKEDMILFAIGLSWHWDAEGLGLSPYRYRKLITHLFGTQGFQEYSTVEPNVTMEPANVLLARIGSRVDQRTTTQFLHRMGGTANLASF